MTPPRIFIAATRQDEGKTTTSLGLLTCLERKFAHVGFMKPVGQRYVEVGNGATVDKDVWLFIKQFGFTDEPQLMSPVTVPSSFTRNYIDHRDARPLEEAVVNAFTTVARGKEFMLLEGTGHAGVGAVFDLSNARVAELLESPAILVTSGGIGKPVDGILLNCALFKAHGVRVAGVIINKVVPDKIKEITRYVSSALAWHGLAVLGVLPYVPLLSQPTLNEVRMEVGGRFISGSELASRLYADVAVISHFSTELAPRLREKTLLVAAGDQSDVLIACAGEEKEMAVLRERVSGILLVEGIEPKHHVVRMLQHAGVPVILTDMAAYDATRSVAELVAKIQPDNPEKVAAIRAVFDEHVEVERIVEAAHGAGSAH